MLSFGWEQAAGTKLFSRVAWLNNGSSCKQKPGLYSPTVSSSKKKRQKRRRYKAQLEITVCYTETFTFLKVCVKGNEKKRGKFKKIDGEMCLHHSSKSDYHFHNRRHKSMDKSICFWVLHVRDVFCFENSVTWIFVNLYCIALFFSWL